MIDVLLARCDALEADRQAAQSLPIQGCHFAPGLVPPVKGRKFPGKNPRLDCVQFAVESDSDVVVLAALAQSAQTAQALRQRIGVRCQRATVAGGSQILAGMKTETTNLSKASHSAAANAGAVGLCGILDDGQSLTPGQAQQGVHWRGFP